MLGRLARRGEDEELLCGDQGEGDSAGSGACGGLSVGVRGDHGGGVAAGDDAGDAAEVDSPG
jgi:hypothetical protein